MRFEVLQRGHRGSGLSRRDGSGEDERAGVMLDVVDDARVRGHVAAEGGEGLREGAHVNVDFLFQTVVIRRTASAFADGAEAVGVVNHHAGAVLLRQAANLRQVGDAAAHGEDAVRDNQAALVFRDGFQAFLEFLHVVVVETQHFAPAQTAGVVNGGVVLTVEDDVIIAADDRGDDAEVGLEPGRKGDDGFFMQELRQFLLELEMHGEGAVQKAGPGTAGAVLLKRLDGGFGDFRTGGQAEVVVGAEHNAAFAFHDDFRRLTALEIVEIGVDFLFPEVILNVVIIAFRENIHLTLFLRDARKSGGMVRFGLMNYKGN